MRSSNMKRSSCASGSGYVASCSIGFCVASTKNGSGSACVWPGGGDGVLLHRLQQRGLRLWRGAVDLVGEDDVREHRALHELEDAATGRVVFLEQLGAGDVRRHEVGRELHAVERQVQRLRQRLDEQRLGEARHADQQHVAAGENRGDQVVDDIELADDASRDLVGEALSRLRELLEQLEVTLVGAVLLA